MSEPLPTQLLETTGTVASTLTVRLGPAKVVTVRVAVDDDSAPDIYTTRREPTFDELRVTLARLGAWARQVDA